jgi:hypothetical protein
MWLSRLSGFPLSSPSGALFSGVALLTVRSGAAQGGLIDISASGDGLAPVAIEVASEAMTPQHKVSVPSRSPAAYLRTLSRVPARRLALPSAAKPQVAAISTSVC